MSAHQHDRIATRAYYLWVAAGRLDGQHEAHWLAAALIEHRLENEAAAANKRSMAARKGAATKAARRIRVSSAIGGTASVVLQ